MTTNSDTRPDSVLQGWRIVARHGVAFVLPAFESIGNVVRVGRFALFINLAWDRFGVGVQFLEAGAIIQIGPVYGGFCHIDKQAAAYERIEAMDAPPSGEPA